MAKRLDDLQDAAGVLRSGGVLVLPTDTLPGLHARADHPEALARIVAVKGRAEGKPMLVLAASLDQARPLLADLDDGREDFCDRCWPGPFSLILPARAGLPGEITGAVENGSGTSRTSVAVRVPDLRPLRDLLEAVGVPLASTSVNRTGQPPETDLATAAHLFANAIDGWWALDDAGGSVATSAQPSALVDVVGWPPRLLRPGPRPLPL